MKDTQTSAARVAVIVPAYGVSHLVGEALASLQAQTLQDWECIIIDDGAPDDVAGAVAPFLSDPRMQFMETENQGVAAARNTAIAHSDAPYIVLLDGDDRFRPTHLERMVAALEADKDARLATCNALIFGAVPKPRLCFSEKQGTGDGTHGSLADVLDRSFGVYIGSMFRRTDFDAVGGFDTVMTHVEDFDMWVRLMLLGGHALYVDDVLGEYRIRSTSASANTIKMLLWENHVYEKAIAQLGDQPEAALAALMFQRNLKILNFERAIDRVIEGDIKSGIAAIREHGELNGPVWHMAQMLWSVFPGLARPMLQWRRHTHQRGNTLSFASFLRRLAIPGEK